MRGMVGWTGLWTLWIGLVASSAWAQGDRLAGSLEFRSADRPIAPPPLRFAEPGLPDVGKSLPTDPPASDEVLKQIDKELGRTDTRSTIGAAAG